MPNEDLYFIALSYRNSYWDSSVSSFSSMIYWSWPFFWSSTMINRSLTHLPSPKPYTHPKHFSIELISRRFWAFWLRIWTRILERKNQQNKMRKIVWALNEGKWVKNRFVIVLFTLKINLKFVFQKKLCVYQ